MKLDSLSIESLKEIIKVAKDEGISELKLESKDFKVSVSFSNKYEQVYHTQSVAQSPKPIADVSINPVVADSHLHVIKSPFVGTFYASPSPGKPVYCKIGDKIKTGQALCVLEAMKIMNEIDSDMSGEIIEICVDNESLVEFGQPLFKIKPN